MKNFFAAAILSLVLFPCISCKKTVNEDAAAGTLMFRFESNPNGMSKILRELPDTNEFLITITEESGEEIFDGVYRDIPEAMEVAPGSYCISVRSEDFSGLKFSAPQYGDEQCVVVPPAGAMTVELGCRQINSGIRLDISPDFLTEYPEGVLFIKTGGARLMYSYTETRIAYFCPGTVSLVLYDKGEETVLMTRSLAAQEILTLKVSAASGSADSGRITILLDTSRVWTNESFVIGSLDPSGTSGEDAMTVSDARQSIGLDDVWVSGFIVGGDLTSANASFSPPFKSASNLLLGPRSSVSSRENCIAVQLPAGDVRDALNLSLNPGMLGRLVCLKGDIESSYYGLVGLKNVSDYILK